MNKLLFTLMNNANIVSVPLQPLAPANQKLVNENFVLDTLFKINRVGYSKEDTEKNIDKPLEVLVRLKEKNLDENSTENLDIHKITDYYTNENDHFVKSVLGLLTDVSSVTPSSTSPLIAINFKNRKNIELNLIKLAVSENVAKVTSFEVPSNFDAKPVKNSFKTNATSIKTSSLNRKIFERVGVAEQMDEDNNHENNKMWYNTTLGVYDAWTNLHKGNPNLNGWIPKIVYNYESDSGDNSQAASSKRHADDTTSIITGVNGINDYHIDIYSAYENLKEQDENKSLNLWIEKMDWMIENGVGVITNSWSYDVSLSKAKKYPYFYGYSERSYYLDFIARKYGIISVFSTGDYERDPENMAISSLALSHNSVMVGSTTQDGSKRSNFSGYKVADDNILTKPLVVAPGEHFMFASTEPGTQTDLAISTGSGTSYAAPVVTGLITTLLRHNHKLAKKPAAILAILTAGSEEIKGYSKDKDNGLNSEVGAGLVNYKRMQKAADNVSFIDTEYFRQHISSEFYLSKDDNINISTAWLYNAGYIDYNEGVPDKPKDYDKKPDWIKDWHYLEWIPIVGYLVLAGKQSLFDEDVKRWEQAKKTYDDKLREHKSSLNTFGKKDDIENWKSIETLKKEHGSSWYTPLDLDLRLERYDSDDGLWREVASSRSSKSNVEFIRFKATKNGKYRIIVEKYVNSNSGIVKERIKGALTYVIN
ncbi:hypothetical protein CJJ23_00480 [Mycoplasmopsis agassizii]|uniref:Peptidase S8/S53 domain-containing protein n=1 Tax=Mycoplasmopsis agassizii TaxID=33922 RepID=A0A269TLI9_9BACT|nr:S8 family serine peptidase [Mycoplasmopsis agassizii]PAK21808.1 hypothetical protein CJJ23_00480 [Mycoplasmopsis agassizii]